MSKNFLNDVKKRALWEWLDKGKYWVEVEEGKWSWREGFNSKNLAKLAADALNFPISQFNIDKAGRTKWTNAWKGKTDFSVGERLDNLEEFCERAHEAITALQADVKNLKLFVYAGKEPSHDGR